MGVEPGIGEEKAAGIGEDVVVCVLLVEGTRAASWRAIARQRVKVDVHDGELDVDCEKRKGEGGE